MAAPSLTLYTGECKSGKTTKLFQAYQEYINKGSSSSEILVIVRNKTLETEFRNNIVQTFSMPLGDIQIFRFRAFVVRVIMTYWDYVFKKPPLFTGFSETIMTMKLFLRFNNTVYPELSNDRQTVRKLFERQQRRAENGLSPAELKVKSGLLKENKIALKAGDFLEDYYKWLNGRDTPVLDYAAQLDCFNQLTDMPEVKNSLLRTFPVAWLIDDIEEAIPVEQLFYEKFWNTGPEFIYTGNNYGGVRQFMGSDPEYLNDLKKKAVSLTELPIHANNRLAELGKNIFEILYSNNSLYNPIIPPDTSYFELKASESYSEMLAELEKCLSGLRDKGVKPEEIAVISPFFNDTLEAEVESMLANHGWALDSVKGSHILVTNPLINTMLTVVRLIFHEENEASHRFHQLSGFEFSQLLYITGNIDNYHLGRLRQKFGNSTEKWLGFIDEYSQKAGFSTLKLINEIITDFKAKKEAISAPHEYREMFTVIWKRLIWKSNYFKQKPSIKEFKIFLEMLENHLEILLLLGIKKPLPEFISQLLNGELSDNPDIPVEDGEGVRFLTLQKLCEIKKETPYQLWLDISSDYWLKNPHHPLVNPNLISRRWDTARHWSLIDEENLLEQSLAKRLRIALSLCNRKAFFFSSDYTVMGQFQNFELIKNLLGHSGLKPLITD